MASQSSNLSSIYRSVLLLLQPFFPLYSPLIHMLDTGVGTYLLAAPGQADRNDFVFCLVGEIYDKNSRHFGR